MATVMTNGFLPRANRLFRRLDIFFGRFRRDLAWLFTERKHFLGNFEKLMSEQHWIFLVGCNNSGTTLLHDLLVSSRHFNAMPHEGQRYTRVIRMAERRHHERVWSEYIEYLRLTENDSTAQVPRLLHDWLRAMGKISSPYFLEKTTANAVRTRWLQKSFQNSYFIGVVRNGYAVSEGICRKGNKSALRAGRHWRKVNEILDADSAYLQNYMLLRYEDLADNPFEQLSRIETFLGLAAGSLTDRIDLSHVTNMNSTSIGSLSEAQVLVINQEAGELLDRYGYQRPNHVSKT